jgi:hypothetical protein
MKELGRLNAIHILSLFAPHFPAPITSNAFCLHNLTRSQRAAAAATAAMQWRRQAKRFQKFERREEINGIVTCVHFD